jgi:hypothetical protein
MTPDENHLLSDLLSRLSVAGNSLSLGFDEVQQWPAGLLATLERAKLVVKDVQAGSLECIGCEHGCFMPIVFTEDALRAFIVCDHPEQQDHMGRIAVDLSRLNQWQLNVKQVAAVLAKLLDVNAKPVYQKETAGYALGMLKGKKGRRAAVLAEKQLSFVLNQRTMPVSELLYIEDSQLGIDTLRIEYVLSSKPPSKGKAYTPQTDIRQANKLATRAMYQDWQDEYKKLRKAHPKKTGAWIALQISKMDIGKGKSSETIRKNMKL